MSSQTRAIIVSDDQNFPTKIVTMIEDYSQYKVNQSLDGSCSDSDSLTRINSILNRIDSHPHEVGVFNPEKLQEKKEIWISVLHYLCFSNIFCSLDATEQELEVVKKVIHVEKSRLHKVRDLNSGGIYSSTLSALMTLSPIAKRSPLHIACMKEKCPPCVIQLLLKACPEVSAWPYSRLSFPPELQMLSSMDELQNYILPVLFYVARSTSISSMNVSLFSFSYKKAFSPRHRGSKIDLLRLLCERLYRSKNRSKNQSKNGEVNLMESVEEILKSIIIVLKARTSFLLPDYDLTDVESGGFLFLHSIFAHQSNFEILCELEVLDFFLINTFLMKKDQLGNTPLHILAQMQLPSNVEENLILRKKTFKFMTEFCKMMSNHYPKSLFILNNDKQNAL